MQKKVIAAVIGGLLIAPAAFADVTISGRLSTGLDIYSLDSGKAAAPAASYSKEQRISDQSSSIVFSGSEDLGGGLSAWFRLDNRFSFPDAGFSASGNTLVGLKGGFGTIGIGRSDLHYHEMFRYDARSAGSLQSWLSGSAFSQVGATAIANNTRTPNVIKWDGSFGAVSATLAYSTAGNTAAATEGSGKGATDGGKGDVTTAALRWQGGPLSLGASIWNSKEEAAVAANLKQSSSRVWGGYDIAGGFSVALGYDQSSVESAGVKTERTSVFIPAKFKTGAETFYASYLMADDLDVGGTTTSNSGATGVSIGWDHALSKKTVIGAHYTKLDNDANAVYQLFARGLSGTAAAAGESVSQIYFGIAHFY